MTPQRSTRSKSHSPAVQDNHATPSKTTLASTSPSSITRSDDHAEAETNVVLARDAGLVLDKPADEQDEIPTDLDNISTRGSTMTSPNTRKQHGGGYDALKSHNGQYYSGMAVGGSHTWNYDPGTWRETKVEPDLWEIDFETTKRRAKNAPTGSGAPVGTEYHWLIVSHQYVKKVDANTYETHLVGSKYKLAHKNSNSDSWSINTVKGQRERELRLLDDAKRRVQGLPAVTAMEKVKNAKQEKGQKSLDQMFGKVMTDNGNGIAGSKRKRGAFGNSIDEDNAKPIHKAQRS